MKKIIAVLLILTVLSPVGIMNSCSCTRCHSSLRGKAVAYDTSTAVKDAKKWLSDTYTNGDSSIVEKELEYYIVPSDNNSPMFMRYFLSNISARDVLVFKGGEVTVIDDDTYDEVRMYNEIFRFDITDVATYELTRLKNCYTNKKNN